MRPIAALLLFVLAAGAQAQLNEDESSMAAWIDGQTNEIEALVERLVNINSGTMNHAGVREVGAILGTELRTLGFETEWIDLPAKSNGPGTCSDAARVLTASDCC